MTDPLTRAAELLEADADMYEHMDGYTRRHAKERRALAAELRARASAVTVTAEAGTTIGGSAIPAGQYALYRPIAPRKGQPGWESLLRAMALPPPPEEG